MLVSASMAGCVKAERPTLLVFTASWCGECHKQMPFINAIAQSGQAEVVVIDYDARPDLVIENSVVLLPTYILKVGGVEQWRTNSGEQAYYWTIGRQ